MGLLNKIFGSDKEDPLKQFAADLGGNYILGHFGDSNSTEVMYQNWMIIFDTYTFHTTAGNNSYQQVCMRVRASFIPRDYLRFKIFRKGLFSTIGKLFGAQDIIIGDPEFDKAFVIKGNDEAKIQHLFSSITLRDIILSHEYLHLEIMEKEGPCGDKIPEGINQLYYLVEGDFKDVDHLKSIYTLFGAFLDQLSKIGSARQLK